MSAEMSEIEYRVTELTDGNEIKPDETAVTNSIFRTKKVWPNFFTK